MSLTDSVVALRPIATEASDHAFAAVCDLDHQPVVWAHLGIRNGASSIAEGEAAVAARAIDDARSGGLPFIMQITAATVSPSDGPVGLHAWGTIARTLSQASGVVPTAVIVDGPIVTGLALILGLFDVVVMTEEALVFVSSPASVTHLTGREVDPTTLGGAAVHSSLSGVAHLIASDLDHAVAMVADVLAHLPANNAEPAPVMHAGDAPDRLCDALERIIPPDARMGYDVRHVAAEILDDGELIELSGSFGRAMLTAFGRLGGHPVGIVANQPAHMAGAIDIESSQKAARFVQWCDAFGIPLLTLVDTPGYLPGRDLEWDGMIRHGGQLAFAYAAASIPRMCVIMRKAFGGAYIVMDCKTMGNDLCVAWPNAEIAVMGAAGAVQILEARQLATLPEDKALSERLRLEAEYTEQYLNPREAARRGFVDAVIDPARTREVLVAALPSLLGKRTEPVVRKHRNGPV